MVTQALFFYKRLKLLTKKMPKDSLKIRKTLNNNREEEGKMLSESGVNSIEIAKAAKFIAMGLCMSLGGIGSALGQGIIGAKSCEAVGKKPECANALFKIMILALAMVETTTIFCLVICIMISMK